MKKDCWEIKNCGRQFGGAKAVELGVCPAAIAEECNGYNGGMNGGRYCWHLTGTLCGGKVQGTFAAKMQNCLACDFFKQVKSEEGAAMKV